MTVNLKFCGGCNPRYDRMEFAEKIKKAYPEIEFLTNAPVDTDAVVILCGCSAACAQVGDVYGSHGRAVLWDPAAWETLCRFLQSVQAAEV